METRQLGNSDMKLTPIGVGAWAMGGGGWAFAWGPQDDDQSIEAIHAALDHLTELVRPAALTNVARPMVGLFSSLVRVATSPR